MNFFPLANIFILLLLASCGAEKLITEKPLTERPLNYDYISGATSLYVLSNAKLGRKAYLIGDRHTPEGRCPPLAKRRIKADDLIYESPERTGKFTDIFLEQTPYLGESAASKAIPGAKGLEPGDLTYKESYLTEIIRQLEVCMKPPFICPHKNMRAHWTDLRAYTGNRLRPIITGAKIQGVILEIPHLFTITTKPNPRVALGAGAEIFLSPEKAMKYLYNHYLNVGKIKKQWEGVPKEYFTALMEHILADLKSKKDIFGTFEKLFKLKEDGTVTISYKDLKSVEFLKNFALFESDLFLYITDAYALGRFLKEFKGQAEPEKPDYAKNAIFYFGDLHIKNMRDYLIKIGFILENSFEKHFREGNTEYELCLDVEGLAGI